MLGSSIRRECKSNCFRLLQKDSAASLSSSVLCYQKVNGEARPRLHLSSAHNALAFGTTGGHDCNTVATHNLHTWVGIDTNIIIYAFIGVSEHTVECLGAFCVIISSSPQTDTWYCRPSFGCMNALCVDMDGREQCLGSKRPSQRINTTTPNPPGPALTRKGRGGTKPLATVSPSTRGRAYKCPACGGN